jgi:hypothetical protein
MLIAINGSPLIIVYEAGRAPDAHNWRIMPTRVIARAIQSKCSGLFSFFEAAMKVITPPTKNNLRARSAQNCRLIPKKR